MSNKEELGRLLVEHLSENEAAERLKRPYVVSRTRRALKGFEPEVMMNVRYGGAGMTGQRYLDGLTSRGVLLSDWATLWFVGRAGARERGFHEKHGMPLEDMLPDSDHFRCAQVEIEADFVRASPADVEAVNDPYEYAPFEKIIKCASRFGLSLCTPEEVAVVRDAYFGQPNSEWLRAAVEPVRLSTRYRAILRIGKEPVDGPQVRTAPCGHASSWQGVFRFLWVKRRRIWATGEEITYEQTLKLAA